LVKALGPFVDLSESPDPFSSDELSRTLGLVSGTINGIVAPDAGNSLSLIDFYRKTHHLFIP
jgi:hypothetical protein